MSRLTEIYEGWKNYIFQTPEIEVLAKERIAVCAVCIHLNILDICSRCSCPKAGKARSPESRCPENSWADGWGTLISSTDSDLETEAIEHEIPIVIWNEEKQEYEEID